MRARRAGGALVLGLALVVHLVALYLPGSPEATPSLVPHLDKLVHVLLFAAPAFLLRRLATTWWPIVALVAHAPVSELVQYSLIPHRSGDPWDLVADVVGVALGVWLAGRTAVRPGRPRG